VKRWPTFGGRVEGVLIGERVDVEFEVGESSLLLGGPCRAWVDEPVT
jgi:hypothetical protein